MIGPLYSPGQSLTVTGQTPLLRDLPTDLASGSSEDDQRKWFENLVDQPRRTFDFTDVTYVATVISTRDVHVMDECVRYLHVLLEDNTCWFVDPAFVKVL